MPALMTLSREDDCINKSDQNGATRPRARDRPMVVPLSAQWLWAPMTDLDLLLFFWRKGGCHRTCGSYAIPGTGATLAKCGDEFL